MKVKVTLKSPRFYFCGSVSLDPSKLSDTFNVEASELTLLDLSSKSGVLEYEVLDKEVESLDDQEVSEVEAEDSRPENGDIKNILDNAEVEAAKVSIKQKPKAKVR